MTIDSGAVTVASGDVTAVSSGLVTAVSGVDGISFRIEVLRKTA
jgi:hypothetical protein